MKGRAQPRRAGFSCPHCGAVVPSGRRACRECGSDAGTGWQNEAEIDYASVDLPDGYRDDSAGDAVPSARRPWWVVAVALLLALLLLWMAIG